MPAKIIAFEGLDCSFKETNSERLYQYLVNKFGEDRVFIYHFPSYGEMSSYFVTEFLKGRYGKTITQENKTLNPYIISMFYAIDRWHKYYTEIMDIYTNHDDAIIIFDRWALSNAFFQAARENNIASRVLKSDVPGFSKVDHFSLTMEHIFFDLPIPNLYLFMDVPYILSKKIRASKENKDINEVDEEFLKSVYENTEYVIQKYSKSGNIKKVVCSDKNGDLLDHDSIFNGIENIVDRYIAFWEFK